MSLRTVLVILWPSPLDISALNGSKELPPAKIQWLMVFGQTVRKAFNAGFIAQDLPWRATHICRHTWGTLGLKANDDNISKVQVNMGHSDRRVSEIYAKAQAQADKSTVEKTAKLMGFK